MDERRDVRSGLYSAIDHLIGVETAARKLANQNFADLISSARGKLIQASEHPDLGRVNDQVAGKRTDGELAPMPQPFDPKADTEAQRATAQRERERIAAGGQPHPIQEPLNSGGNPLFSAGDPGARLQAEEATRRGAFAASGAIDPATGRPFAPDPSRAGEGVPGTMDPGPQHYPPPGAPPSYSDPSRAGGVPNVMNPGPQPPHGVRHSQPAPSFGADIPFYDPPSHSDPSKVGEGDPNVMNPGPQRAETEAERVARLPRKPLYDPSSNMG